MNRRALTLVELLVAITLMVLIATIATMTFANVDKATRRTLALMQVHQNAGALMQRIEGDLQNMQPNVALNLAEHHLTFMRAHGEGLEMEDDGTTNSSGSSGSSVGDRHIHDLIWVRWAWRDGTIVRASTPPFSSDPTAGNSKAGSAESGRSASPQQFYHYFEPDDLPDRFDPDLEPSIESLIASWTGGLAPIPTRALDTDVYWRPERVWWHPGSELEPNRSRPGAAVKLETGNLVDLRTRKENAIALTVVDDISYQPPRPLDPAPSVAFAVVNPAGYSVNRDYLNLVGTHPDDPLHTDFPSRMTPISEQVLNVRFELFAHEHDPLTGDLLRDGMSMSAIDGADPSLGPGAFAGLPMNPSADLDPARPALAPEAGLLPAPIPALSRDLPERPVKLELHFVMHSIPPNKQDRGDLDGDGDLDENLAGALYQRLAALGPVDDQTLVQAIAAEGFVAVAFCQALALPH